MKTFLTCCKTVGLATALALVSTSANAHSVNHKATIHHKAHVAEPSYKHKTHDENPHKRIDGLIRQYSLTGDDHLIEKGWALWHALPQKTPEVLLQGAWLAQAEHQFDDARKWIAKALAHSPNNAQAWLLQASIALLQGDTQAATQACRQVASRVSAIVSISCQAKLARTDKQKQKAYKVLTQLIHLPMDKDIQPWVYATTADLAKALGDLPAAENWYKQAVSLQPSVQNRAAYAEILLAQKHHQKVLKFIDKGEHTPALKLRRLLAQHALGQNINEEIDAIDRLFKTWIAQNDVKHAREMAHFYLALGNDIPLAYELAKKNIAIQKEIEDIALLEKSAEAFTSARR